MKNGVIFIATGKQYVLAACEAAKSIRQYSPNLLIDLFTDQAELDLGIFDQVHTIADPHYRSKVDYIHQTRFERTLYLDSDVRIIADIEPMFDVLDKFDVALCHAHARNKPETNEIWNIAIPESFSQMNGGVILYKSSSGVLDFMKEWGRSFHQAGFKKDQVTLRELLWKSDLRLYVLPPEYNIRYRKYLKSWHKREARPRILHFQEFNHVYQGSGLTQRLKYKIRTWFPSMKHVYQKIRQHLS